MNQLLNVLILFLVRAVKLDPDLGDSWACFYRFELQHGTEVSLLFMYPNCTLESETFQLFTKDLLKLATVFCRPRPL